ncbi:hypothetical protein SAMN03159496_04589 [Rhizobium sp. NFR07]|nr:hypothetical protein SAMN03159496_04589 [Rhizobium sp. NFR07]
MSNFTQWEWVLFLFGFDKTVRKMQLRRAQKVQETWFAKCEENKGGWIS